MTLRLRVQFECHVSTLQRLVAVIAMHAERVEALSMKRIPGPNLATMTLALEPSGNPRDLISELRLEPWVREVVTRSERARGKER